jgi:hypothetical protein
MRRRIVADVLFILVALALIVGMLVTMTGGM